MKRQAIIKTKSGSVYVVKQDGDDIAWSRVDHSPESNELRTESGDLIAWPKWKLGERMIMLGPGLTIGTRLIFTTEVQSVEEALVD